MIFETRPIKDRNTVYGSYLQLRGIVVVCLTVICTCVLLGVTACTSTPADETNTPPVGEPAEQSQDQSPPEQQAESPPPDENKNEDLAEENQAPAADDEAPASSEMIQEMWSGSPHADTFILDDAGNNNTCARCHSPVVWLPSMDDMPESCFACKFEVSDPPPLIPESEWVQIECSVCHEVDKKGNVAAEYAWLEIAQIGEYAEVASPSELCLKCHIDSGAPGHVVPQLAGAHARYECTECHDAHDAVASCTSSGCHEDVLDPAVPGHDQDHESVTCAACHDAGELVVNLDEEQGLWLTFAKDPDGGDTLIPLVSHNTVKEAPCERCHSVDNPWGLTSELE